MKQNRTQLKTYFLTNSIPKQGDFYDFIESGLNQNDDGIVKLDAGPIGLQAQGDQKEVLHLYLTTPAQNQPAAWKINLNPSSRPGFNIYNPSGSTRLFIADDGKVGIGTTNPIAFLDIGLVTPGANGTLGTVLGRLAEGNDEGDGTFLGVKAYGTLTTEHEGKSFSIEHSFYGHINSSINFFRGGGKTGGCLSFNVYNNTEALRITGDGNVGIGTTNPEAKLRVTGGAIMPDSGDGANAGILFPGNPGGGAGDAAWIRYYGGKDDNGVAIYDTTVLEIGTSNDKDDHIALMPSGNVGIGTTNPIAKLDVSGFGDIGNTAYAFFAYKNNKVDSGASSINNPEVSIRATHRIVAKEFNATSDARIKKDFAPSNTAANLQKLNRLAVTDYYFKDKVGCGNAVQTGFIAQEVEKVFPEAVATHPDFIPDVYALASAASLHENVLTVTMKEAHGLQTGDIVRLIRSSGAMEVKVKKLDDTTFEVHNWKENADLVFVYGKKVNDFRTLNYTSIFSLGISAIQELYRQIEHLKEELATVTRYMPGKLAVS